MSSSPFSIASLQRFHCSTARAVVRSMSLESHVKPSPRASIGMSQPLGRPVLSESRARMLDELEHPDPEVPSPGAEDHSQRGGRLALPLAGIHDDQTMPDTAALRRLGGSLPGIPFAHDSPPGQRLTQDRVSCRLRLSNRPTGRSR